MKRVICCCCCLCCRPQLLWNLFSLFVSTPMLWSKCSHNFCVLLQVEIVSTWVGNARTNTPKLRMASTSHLFLVSAWVFKPTKMRRGVIRLFCVSDVITALVTSYCGRQSFAKLTAQSYFMIIAWLLIALSHTVQSVWNFLKLVELIHLKFFFLIFLKVSLGTLLTSELLKQIRFCIACNIQGFPSVC